jgi:hypothetical protein
MGGDADDLHGLASNAKSFVGLKTSLSFSRALQNRASRSDPGAAFVNAHI